MRATGPMADDAEALAVYAAEDAALVAWPLRRFRRFAEVGPFVEAVTTSSWWDESFPAAPVEVVVQRRSRTATFSAAAETPDEVGVLALVDGRGWGLETVLHELAHLAAGRAAGHGPRFRAALLELWRREAGIEAWAALSAALTAAVTRSGPGP